MFDSSTKVLIVDDLVVMRKFLVEILRHLGMTDITQAVDGDAGWRAINEAQEPFGLIISDFTMPNGSGLQLLQRVREHKHLTNIPFIMITSRADKQAVGDAVEAGVNAYVIKPFSGKVLQGKLAQVHARRPGPSAAK